MFNQKTIKILAIFLLTYSTLAHSALAFEIKPGGEDNHVCVELPAMEKGIEVKAKHFEIQPDGYIIVGSNRKIRMTQSEFAQLVVDASLLEEGHTTTFKHPNKLCENFEFTFKKTEDVLEILEINTLLLLEEKEQKRRIEAARLAELFPAHVVKEQLDLIERLTESYKQKQKAQDSCTGQGGSSSSSSRPASTKLMDLIARSLKDPQDLNDGSDYMEIQKAQLERRMQQKRMHKLFLEQEMGRAKRDLREPNFVQIPNFAGEPIISLGINRIPTQGFKSGEPPCNRFETANPPSSISRTDVDHPTLKEIYDSIMNPEHWRRIAKGYFENEIIKYKSEATLVIREENEIFLIIEQDRTRVTLAFVDDSGNRLPIIQNEDERSINIGEVLNLTLAEIGTILTSIDPERVSETLEAHNLRVSSYDKEKRQIVFKLGPIDRRILLKLPLIELDPPITASTSYPDRPLSFAGDAPVVIQESSNAIFPQLPEHRRTNCIIIRDVPLGDPRLPKGGCVQDIKIKVEIPGTDRNTFWEQYEKSKDKIDQELKSILQDHGYYGLSGRISLGLIKEMLPGEFYLWSIPGRLILDREGMIQKGLKHALWSKDSLEAARAELLDEEEHRDA